MLPSQAKTLKECTSLKKEGSLSAFFRNLVSPIKSFKGGFKARDFIIKSQLFWSFQITDTFVIQSFKWMVGWKLQTSYELSKQDARPKRLFS